MNPYVIAVRAPDSGIEEFKDGSWRVVSEHYASDRLCVERAKEIMPYVITHGGGQVAVYEFDKVKGQLKGKPVTIGRSAANSEFPIPKDHTEIAEYEPPVAEKLNSNVDKYGAAHGAWGFARIQNVNMRPNVVQKKVAWRIGDYIFATTGRMAATCAITAVLSLATAIMIGAAVQKTKDKIDVAVNGHTMMTLEDVDLDERSYQAIKDGAVQIARPAPGRPHTIQIVRIYPAAYGNWVDIVEEVPSHLFNSPRYTRAKSTVPWRSRDQIPTAETVYRP